MARVLTPLELSTGTELPVFAEAAITPSGQLAASLPLQHLRYRLLFLGSQRYIVGKDQLADIKPSAVG